MNKLLNFYKLNEKLNFDQNFSVFFSNTNLVLKLIHERANVLSEECVSGKRGFSIKHNNE
jgi:hypothetical protein